MLNVEGESALHEACLRDRPENVEQLLRWGLDPMLTKSYRFPIHCAASMSSVRSADDYLLLMLLLLLFLSVVVECVTSVKWLLQLRFNCNSTSIRLVEVGIMTVC